jgi:hypothetical protein
MDADWVEVERFRLHIFVVWDLGNNYDVDFNTVAQLSYALLYKQIRDKVRLLLSFLFLKLVKFFDDHRTYSNERLRKA